MISNLFKILPKLALFFILFSINTNANIQLIKKENSDSNTTLLVIGGIHGNEPGGYYSPAILATHYKITSKNLWIVPNLNKKSIQANVRGIHGDMNRKFASIKKSDKDKKIVQEIKKIILSKKVSLILNLHDGHGFYRKKNLGSIFNPNAWGQTCVIDQCTLEENKQFSDLNNIASSVKKNLNKNLLQNHHIFDVRNTNTKFDDEAMQLSLTYFAVTHNKPAFAIETSKNLPSLSKKVFYQLLAIEEFMNIMGITFVRDFELNEKSIKKILKNYGNLAINNNILFNLNNIKKSLSYIPLNSNGNTFKFSNPLGSIKKVRGGYFVYVGNKRLTKLKPQYFKMSTSCSKKFDVEIDGKKVSLSAGENFSVNNKFNIAKTDKRRVNIIGFSSKGIKDESGINISAKDLNHRFSIDRANKLYRVEFYRGGKFCSMSIVKFK